MQTLELFLMLFLILGLVILARIEAYKQGYKAGELDGAERMWKGLTDKPFPSMRDCPVCCRGKNPDDILCEACEYDGKN